MKVRVVSELTPFRRKKFRIIALCMSFIWIVFISFCFDGLISKEHPENAFAFVPVIFLTMILLSRTFYSMTIEDNLIRISADAATGFPKKIKLNESRDVYLIAAEYSATRSNMQNGFLISNAPIEDTGKKFLRKNTLTAVYSQNFLNALKEHTNLHIIGELREEVDIL